MNTLRGPLCLVSALGLFAVLDANSKLLAGTYAWDQVMVFRYLTLLPLLLLIRALRPGAGGPLATAHPRLHALRAVFMVGSGAGFFLALREIPLAEGYLVYFTAPFLVLGLAVAVLHERTGPAVWAWSAVGFAGVVVALWPNLAGHGPWAAYLWALFGTCCYAVVMTINRQLRHEPGAAVLLFWSSLYGLLICIPFAVTGWVWPSPVDALALMLNGVLAGAATVLLAAAFRFDSAARLAPLEFSALLFAIALDFAVWRIVPSGFVISGAAIVIFACLMSQRAALRG